MPRPRPVLGQGIFLYLLLFFFWNFGENLLYQILFAPVEREESKKEWLKPLLPDAILSQ
jgi:hypothetical protein